MPKVYVTVDFENGLGSAVRPKKIYWPDGKSWEITRVLFASDAPVGEYEGIRYTVVIGSAQKYLYKDGDRWYVMSP